MNLIESVIAKYNSLTASRPTTLWYNYPLLQDPNTGIKTRTPIIRFDQIAEHYNITFETITWAHPTYQFYAYDTTIDGVQAMFDAVMWNAEDPQNRAGFAYGDFTAYMPSGMLFEQMMPIGETPITRLVNQRTGSATNCYVKTWTMTLQVENNSGKS